MALAVNADKQVESLQISFNNSTDTEHNFGSGNAANDLYLKTSANVYIGFDEPANSADFLLEAADRVVRFAGAKCTRLHALGASGSGTLYVVAVKHVR